MVRPCSCPASDRDARNTLGECIFRNAAIDGRKVMLWVDTVEKGLALIGEQ
jgi:hypothetical protein